MHTHQYAIILVSAQMLPCFQAFPTVIAYGMQVIKNWMWEASGTRQVAGSPLLIGSKSAWRVASYSRRVQLHKI